MSGERESQSAEPRIIVDEDWKSKVEAEREQLRRQAEAAAASAAGSGSATESSQAEGESAGARPVPELPPASLLTLIETLAMQAMASLSQAAAPPPADASQAKGPESDPAFHLAMAKHLIDSLDVLQTKTRGNTTAEEAQHLENVLHDLRLAYVQVRSRRA